MTTMVDISYRASRSEDGARGATGERFLLEGRTKSLSRERKETVRCAHVRMSYLFARILRHHLSCATISNAAAILFSSSIFRVINQFASQFPPRFIGLFTHIDAEEAFVVVVSVLVLRCFGAAATQAEEGAPPEAAVYASSAPVPLPRGREHQPSSASQEAPRGNRRVSFPRRRRPRPSVVARLDASERGKERGSMRENVPGRRQPPAADERSDDEIGGIRGDGLLERQIRRDELRHRYAFCASFFGRSLFYARSKRRRSKRMCRTFFSSFLSFDRLLFADDIDARDDADREDTRTTTTTTTDAVRLKDGTLLATHPQRLFDWIQKEAKDVTLEEARALGANERSFATMEDLIAHFAKMTGTRGAKKGARRALRETLLLAHELGKNIGGMGSSSKRIGIDGTFFGVDLKGDALNAENVVLVNEFAKKANVVDAVSYYVTDPESEASKNIQKALERSFPKSEDRIKMTWALRDVDGSHWNTEKLARENLERMNIRGLLPSAKFDEKWYSKAVKESNAWVESWVADDLETALELRKKGVHAMISNVPEAVIEGIKQFCMNGESRELAVKALVKMRGM